MIYNDVTAVAFVKFALNDNPVAGGIDRGPYCSGEVHPCMEFKGLVDGVHPVAERGGHLVSAFIF